jgi:uncharacterized protein (DUF169 family)
MYRSFKINKTSRIASANGIKKTYLEVSRLWNQVLAIALTKNDWAILDKFHVPPVGIKYLTKRPQGIGKLGKELSLCEMLKAAFEGNSFYANVKNHACDAGLYILGKGAVDFECLSD